MNFGQKLLQKIPQDAFQDLITITKKIKQQGYECFLVGGAVRDLVMNQTPGEYDLTTSATPEEIKNLFDQFEDAASEIEGVECWSARELQKLLGYNKWENFEKVIDKAKAACTNAGEDSINWANQCCFCWYIAANIIE